MDPNFLKVFDAVMEEQSVLRASQKLALSQSAVNHSLARLREILEDDLFVRTATGMQPTSRALAMSSQVRNAFLALEAAVESPTFNAHVDKIVHVCGKRLHQPRAGATVVTTTR
ncbi:LysR family transcriptional regulator [Bradyrhizobium liaoningense]|uniref:LysR family transcriptional regulator n=1 Tax=Bradyrhizobium liaoningense TaxID=43992 RepID=UPI0024C0C548|nr:LysR family transcriptional regulator [Bradyrhizobium liaoningense]